MIQKTDMTVTAGAADQSHLSFPRLSDADYPVAIELSGIFTAIQQQNLNDRI